MTRRLLAAALIALAPLPALAQGECAGRITVQGAGTVTAVPDLLRITFRAQAESADPSEALAEAARRTERMLAAIAAQGVAPEDLATVEVSLAPVYERPTRDEPPRIVNWRAASGAAVTLRDLSLFGTLIREATGAGATGLGGFAFDVTNREELLGEARALAVTDALARATQMADAAGLRLGPVLEINEAGWSVPRPFEARAVMMSDASPVPEMPLAPGSADLTANVGLTAALCP